MRIQSIKKYDLAGARICAVIGNPVSHSLSPCIHNQAYAYLGLQNQFVFTSIETHEQHLDTLLEGAKVMNFAGLAVTAPFKQRIIPFLDELDEHAKSIGAVNTVVFDHGAAIGRNTDWRGVLDPVSLLRDLTGRKVAIIGSGGAAAAAGYAFLMMGAEIIIFGRDEQRSNPLVKKLQAKFYPLSRIAELKQCELIFQATPVGSGKTQAQSLIPQQYLAKEQLVFESIYHPLHTRLLHDASKVGAQIITGEKMLLHQAYFQFEMFTGVKAPKECMAEALSHALELRVVEQSL